MAAPVSSEEEGFLSLLIQMLSHVLNGYLTTFFVVTGILLNTFSIFIFLRCDRGGTPAIQYYLVSSVILDGNIKSAQQRYSNANKVINNIDLNLKINRQSMFKLESQVRNCI